MKDTMIITSFKRTERAINDLAKNQQQIAQQTGQYLNSFSITLDGLVQMLIERGIFTGEEFKAVLQREAQRRQQAAQTKREDKMEDQPKIDNDASGPTVEEAMMAEETTVSKG